MKRIRTNRRKELKRKNFRTLIAGITAVAVVMGSSYFVVPTFATDTFCGLEEHTHDDFHDYQYDTDCYGCKIEENYKVTCTTPEHEHTLAQNCYELTCGSAENHTHGAECYAAEESLKCTVHVCGEGGCVLECADKITDPEHECVESGEGACVKDTCTLKTDHVHGRNLDETEAEIPGTGCYEFALTCTHLENHTHAVATCYNLTCETPTHTHSYENGCYTPDVLGTEEVTVEVTKLDENGEPVLDGDGNKVKETKTETVDVLGHIHGDGNCQNILTCELTEHPSHVARCYLDEEAEAAADYVIELIKALNSESDDAAVKEALVYYGELNDLQKAVLADADDEKAEGTEYSYAEKLAALELNMDIKNLPAFADALDTDLTTAKTLLAQLSGSDKAQAALLDDDKLTATDSANTAINTYAELFAEAEEIEDDLKDKTGDALANAWNRYMKLKTAWRTLVTISDETQAKIDALANVRVIDDAVVVPNATVKIFNYNTKQPSTANNLVENMYFVSPVPWPKDATDPAVKADYADNTYYKAGGTLVEESNTYYSYEDGNTYVELDTSWYQDTVLNSTSSYFNYMPKMIRSNNDDGYPNTAVGSMRPLFENPVATMENGGGLFQMRNGYYYYDSQENAAAYNSDKDEFDLYNVVVQPKHRFTESDRTALKEGKKTADELWGTPENWKLYWTLTASKGSFFPFNPLKDADGSLNVEQFSYFKNQIEAATASTVDADDRLPVGYYDKVYHLTDPTDLSFGMMIEMDFFMPEGGKVGNDDDMIFHFRGDDDVVVYIDNMPAMDLAGAWSSREGHINFATGTSVDDPMNTPDAGSSGPHTGTKGDQPPRTRRFDEIFVDESGNPDMSVLQLNEDGTYTLKENTTHTLKFFFLERGGDVSNCFIEFNMPTVPPSALMVEKELETNTLTSTFANKLDYSFRVMETNGTTDKADDTVMISDTAFDIYEKGADGTLTDTKSDGWVNENGIFTLNGGEIAVFPHMLSGDNVGEGYYVQELIPVDKAGDYKVTCVTELTGTPDENGNMVYTSAELAVNSSGEMVKFKNKLEGQGKLQITKEVTADSNSIFKNTFEVEVDINGKPIADGVTYTVSETGKDDTTGTTSGGKVELKAGQTVEITGIPVGATVEVQEVGGAYDTVYKYTVEKQPENPLVALFEGGDAPAGSTPVEPTEPAAPEYEEVLYVDKDGAPADKVVDTITKEDTLIEVIIENESDEFVVPFSIDKIAAGVAATMDKAETYEFIFDVVEVNAEGNPVEKAEFTLVKADHTCDATCATGTTCTKDITVKGTTVTIPIQSDVIPDADTCNKCKALKQQADAAALVAAKDAAGKAAEEEQIAAGVTDEAVIAAAVQAAKDAVTEATAEYAVNETTGHMAECDEDDVVVDKPKTAALKFVFNEETAGPEPGEDHYFKITERIPTGAAGDNTPDHRDKFEYDTTEYLVTIHVNQDAKGARAVVTKVEADNNAETDETASYVTNGKFTSGLAFQNGKSQNVKVTKIWASNVPADKRIPVTVTLKDEAGIVRGSATLSDANGWMAEWTGLNENTKYTVEETVPEGMDVTYNGSGTAVQTITNSMTPDDPPTNNKKNDPKPEEKPKDKPKDNPKEESGDVLGIDDENIPLDEMVLADEEVLAAETGDSNHIVAAVAAMAAALAGILFLKKRKEN